MLSWDGSQLYVPTVDGSGKGWYQIIDRTTMETVGSENLGFFNSFGFGSVAQWNGKLYMPPGPKGQFGILRVDDTRFGGTGAKVFVGSEQLPFLATLVVEVPAQSFPLSGSGQKAYVNTTFINPIVVLVIDGAGNRMPDQQVNFSFDSDNGFYNGWGPLALITTGADGTATSPTILAGTTPGTLTVIASVEGLPDLRVPLTILATPIPPSVTTLTADDGKVTVGFNPGDGHGTCPPASPSPRTTASPSNRPV